jgi:hypothetical protein
MRAPQQVHGRGSMRGWSAAGVFGVSGCSERTGTASNSRARAMLAMTDAVEAAGQHVHQEAARVPLASSP